MRSSGSGCEPDLVVGARPRNIESAADLWSRWLGLNTEGTWAAQASKRRQRPLAPAGFLAVAPAAPSIWPSSAICTTTDLATSRVRILQAGICSFAN